MWRKKKVSTQRPMCEPSTSASVMITDLVVADFRDVEVSPIPVPSACDGVRISANQHLVQAPFSTFRILPRKGGSPATGGRALLAEPPALSLRR